MRGVTTVRADHAIDLLRRAVRRGAPASATQSSLMFGRIRWRLTLWYSGVLAAALLLCGTVVYVQTRDTLLSTVDQQLVQQYAGASRVCSHEFGIASPPAPPDFTDERSNLLLVCYYLTGSHIALYPLADSFPHYVDAAVAVSVAHSDSVTTEIVDTGPALGRVETRYYRLIDFFGNVYGVVQVGTPVGAQLDALDVLLHLLLAVGVLALLAASVGGFFLANRALVPARLAYTRQSEFIADASHELRTPLTMLRADAEVLLRGRKRLPADDALILEDVVAETSHMANLANSMLNLARLDSGSAQIEREVVDLGDLAHALGRRIGPLADERQIDLRVEREGAALVIGDRLLLEQAALVMLDNAVKYNHQGGEVVIRARVEDGRALLEVRDTGMGIAAEHLPRLGERFYRVDKARSREAGGAGLGVSIAQSIAAQHGGSLALSSEPGKGTTAILTLPAARNIRQGQ